MEEMMVYKAIRETEKNEKVNPLLIISNGNRVTFPKDIDKEHT
jgi:hypothetical protein